MMQLPWIGFRIFKWLLLLVAVLVALISVYAWRTYPTDQQILTVLGSEASAAERLAGVAATRQAWLSSIKDLAQISIFSSVFPAITGVFGYIFGVSKQRSDGGAAGQGRGLGA
ncbi:MAG: hypothetical protein IPK24_06120 [Kineosporiaceae bacterium]|nr:hypothetical protein [Kineosporiaceae bacterium]